MDLAISYLSLVLGIYPACDINRWKYHNAHSAPSWSSPVTSPKMQ